MAACHGDRDADLLGDAGILHAVGGGRGVTDVGGQLVGGAWRGHGLRGHGGGGGRAVLGRGHDGGGGRRLAHDGAGVGGGAGCERRLAGDGGSRPGHGALSTHRLVSCIASVGKHGASRPQKPQGFLGTGHAALSVCKQGV